MRVGVHIADVSFFVEAGSALDDEARRRGTSTYLVNEVMPMLPRLLCEDLCSLNPGVERLTFSAEWEMSADGEVRGEWFGRGVIRSCAKLDYGTAQAVIDARDAGGSGMEALEEAVAASKHGNGPVKVDDANPERGSLWCAAAVAEAVGDLNLAARAMRARRFAGGALGGGRAPRVFRLDAAAGSIDAAFLFGDVSYAVGYQSVWDDFFEMITPWAAKIPFLVCPGNHEYDYTRSAWIGRRDGDPSIADRYGGADSGGVSSPAC